jgi:hypothetical protein
MRLLSMLAALFVAIPGHAQDSAIERGLDKAGKAIERGAKATGRAVERAGRAVQKGGAKVHKKVDDAVRPKKTQ